MLTFFDISIAKSVGAETEMIIGILALATFLIISLETLPLKTKILFSKN